MRLSLTCGLLSLLVVESSARVLDRRLNGMNACNRLQKRFSTQTFLPNSTTYDIQINDYHSTACVLSPDCVFMPNSAQDVSAFMKIIGNTQSPFSVRSGGHMPVPGAANNNNGVLLALSNLNNKTLNQDHSVASIGGGQTWLEVYNWIAPFGLGVAGGRYGEVGVGGLLTGGGINFFGNHHGWGSSNIVGHQVVLGDGTILEVSKTSHADLHWALKGGNNNFGIVTRFDVKTIPITSAYTGGVIWDPSTTGQVLDAIAGFIGPGGGMSDLNTVINPVVAITPGNGQLFAGNIPFVQGSDPNPASLANFTNIPNATFNDVSLRTNWASIPAEVATPQFNINSNRVIFRSIGIKAVPEMVNMTYDIVIGSAATHLKPFNDSNIDLAYQPITKEWIQAARDAGGDALDLDPADGAFILVLITCSWIDPAHDAPITSWSEAVGANLTQAAEAKGIYYPFIYLNDAAPGQKPYPLYGKGKSLPKMKQVQNKYDPQGILQQLETSGYKLS